MICHRRDKRGTRPHSSDSGERGSGDLRRARQLIIAIGTLAALSFGMSQTALAGYAAYIIDRYTGVVLHQENADTLNYPASLTKMMTLYLVFEAIDQGKVNPKTPIIVSKYASQRPPSKLGLKAGQTIFLEDAIKALATKSANDVATALAEYFGGSEKAFGVMMTDRARALGMTQSTFRNASGLPNKKQRTTARDIGTLAQALYSHYPHHMHYFGNKSFVYKGRRYRNTNRLLGVYKGMDGIKTGYIRASGYNLAASVRRDEHHIIAVVLGGKTAKRRDRQMKRLLDKAFANVDQITHVLNTVGRPRYKPDPIIAMAPGNAARRDGLLPDRLGAAAVAVGEALTTYVAIPSAEAHQGMGRDWAIQVGAYSRADTAVQALEAAAFVLPGLLTETKRQVDPVVDQHGTLYRARQVGLTEDEARRACQALEEQWLPCMVTGPAS